MFQRSLFAQAGLADAAALNFAAPLPWHRDALLAVTRGRPDAAAVYYLVWLDRSAMSRIVEQRHRDFLASRDPDTRRLGEKLLSTRQRLSHLLLAPVKDAPKHAKDVREL